MAKKENVFALVKHERAEGGLCSCGGVHSGATDYTTQFDLVVSDECGQCSCDFVHPCLQNGEFDTRLHKAGGGLNLHLFEAVGADGHVKIVCEDGFTY